MNKDSLREAILNAIVHKDYATGIPIQIRVYDDKVTIFNAGALPAKWTIQDLLTFHISVPHNPDIANAFFKSGMTEAWGRGIEKIINSSVSAGKPKPVFEIIGNGLLITFLCIPGDRVNDRANDRVKSVNPNETQQKIMALMIENPGITAETLSIKVGITERNIRTNIKKLRDAGLVERVGADKNGNWIVNPRP
ncbi:MAG: winged helix-turn-helix transcriptional regulator [Oscillospiraceae bacterium]|nr:winged helix-turn-helix transcriptional regulator [Oscillospiraceae bacterium]